MTMNTYELTYKPFGESAILIEWPAEISEGIIQDIVAFDKKLAKQQEIVDTIIAYNSLTVKYRRLNNYSDHYKYRDAFEKTVAKLKELYAIESEKSRQQQKSWQVPVCYDLEFGKDLKEIAAAKQLSIEEVIRLHSEPSYLIYFLGFQPGFLYLGGLNEQIHMPRRANPRLRVAKGSVGIGGEQTGVYPQDSAGGWNLIGRSPIDFFNVEKSQPCFAKAGDRIQFVPVDIDTFYEIQDSVHSGTYKIKSL